MYWKKEGNSFATEFTFSSWYHWDLGRFMQSPSGNEISNSYIFTGWCPNGSSSAAGKHDSFAWWGSYKILSENSSCNSERQSHAKIIPQHSRVTLSWVKRWKVAHLWFGVPDKATRNHLGGEQRGKLRVFLAVPWIRREASGFVSRGRGRSARQKVWFRMQTHMLNIYAEQKMVLCMCVCVGESRIWKFV